MTRITTLAAIMLLPVLANAKIITLVTESKQYYYVDTDATPKVAKIVRPPSGYYSGSQVFPSAVRFVDDIYTVNEVGDWAFCKGENTGNDEIISVTLPNTITKIDIDAFYGCSNLTSVNIPEGVTEIGHGAFSQCFSLPSITLPEGLKQITYNLFNACSSLTTITIPSSVTDIGKTAFTNCTGLTSLTMNCNPTLGNDVFKGCSNLKEVTFNGETVPAIFSQWDLEKVTIGDKVRNIANRAFYKCTSLKTLALSNQVETIGKEAFYQCSQLETLTLPSQLTDLGEAAFANCSSLTDLTMSGNQATIGTQAFYNCYSLSNVTMTGHIKYMDRLAFGNCTLETLNITDMAAWCSIDYFDVWSGPIAYVSHFFYNGQEVVSDLVIPEGVTSLGLGAFAGRLELVSVSLPSTLTSIGNYAFYTCPKLASVTLPDGVTSIGDNAFGECSALSTITLSQKLKSIGYRAFYNCKKLKTLNVPPTLADIGYNAFQGCSGLEIVNITDIAAWCSINFGNDEESVSYSNPQSYSHCLYKDGKMISELTIPEGVTEIKSRAFASNYGLESVTIPSTVTKIDDYAFGYCKAIAEMICRAKDVPTVTSKTFYDGSQTSIRKATLYVPESSLEKYKNAAYWKTAKEILAMPDDMPTKCATPYVSYEKGKITFHCDTEGAEIVSFVDDANVRAHNTNRIQAEPTYIVRAYARMKGCENSEVMTAKFVWHNANPQITYIK